MTSKSRLYQVLYYVLPLTSLACFFIIWFVVAKSTNYIIPSPFQVLTRFQELLHRPIARMSVFRHAGVSLTRVLAAIGYSILLGIPFGLMLGWSDTFSGIFKPIFEMLRPIPPIAWIPLITMWFGIGETPKIMIIFLGTITPIVLNTYTGVAMVPRLNIDAGFIFGANNRRMLFDIILPSAFPAIFAGIRTAISSGWVVMLAAEMVSAKSGLGFLVIRGSDSNDLALTGVAMVFIGTIGALLSMIFSYLERRLCPWIEKSN
ncbi:MAG: ABC transporter permease [Planctomycetes bacterium]|nr:ABC transporter permease [Planctomycetota bacterium]